MSVLSYDQMNSIINYLTAKSTWDDPILYHKGPFDVKESRIMDLKLCYKTFKFKEDEFLTQTFARYKALMNELVNDGFKLSKLEINIGFINRLPKKWLSFCQSLRNTNHVKHSKLASLFGKLKYEENLINSIYKTKKIKSLVSTTSLSTAFISTSIVQNVQDSPDNEEDTRSSQEYMNDLEKEYQARILLAKSKRFYKKGTQRMPSMKMTIVDPKFKARPFVRYPLFDPLTPWDQCKPILGTKFENPQQLKNMLANYRVSNGYQLWFMQDSHSKLLVYCGRDISKEKCAAFKGKKPKEKIMLKMSVVINLQQRSLRKKNTDEAECSSKPETKKKGMISETIKETWNDKKENEKRDCKSLFPVLLGRLFWNLTQEVHVFWRLKTRMMERITLKGCIFVLRVSSKAGNNQMYLITWVVVGVENRENWAWFLSLLQKDLELGYVGGVTVIFDRHKGLIEVVADLPALENCTIEESRVQDPDPKPTIPTQESQVQTRSKIRKQVAASTSMRIYVKNKSRSERIANMKAKKFKFDANGLGSTAEKAFDVSEDED
nr:retrovirus-related Pol polyprotein from transposon TNT 1-94 [Tanacetum cinerariifolium]